MLVCEISLGIEVFVLILNGVVRSHHALPFNPALHLLGIIHMTASDGRLFDCLLVP